MGTQTLLLIFLGLFTFICIGIDKHRNLSSPLPQK